MKNKILFMILIISIIIFPYSGKALNKYDVVNDDINLKVEDINETVEFNYVIDERFWNKGYMSEALNLVKDYCLNELCVNRFQGGCCIENLVSKRVMEKCNMINSNIIDKIMYKDIELKCVNYIIKK